MFITPHILVGSTIAVATGNPAIIILGGLTSHIILDALPHTDWGTWHEYKSEYRANWLDWVTVSVDLLFSLIIFIWLIAFRHFDFWFILLAFFSSSILDIFVLDHVFNFKKKIRDLPILKNIYALEKKTHFRLNKRYWILGILTQILVMIGGIWCLQRF